MNPRYQIFVSSTFQDLKDARERVIYELMRNGFIAVGMEQFHATDEEQMEYIRPLIDQTDYYVVIVKGRYGSLAADGMSYTEKEYRYALEKGVPVLAFLYDDIQSLSVHDTDDDSDKLKKFKLFREELMSKRIVSFWRAEDDLVSKVKDAVFGIAFRKPRIGWIRGDQALDPGVYKELELARKKIHELEQSVVDYIDEPIPFPESLAHGSDEFEFEGILSCFSDRGKQIMGAISVKLSWESIFMYLVEQIYHEAEESYISYTLAQVIAKIAAEPNKISIDARYTFDFSEDYIVQIRFHLQALGLITTAVGGNGIRWQLTEKGRKYISNLKAIRRAVPTVTIPPAPPP